MNPETYLVTKEEQERYKDYKMDNEVNILSNPIFDIAFERILNNYKPRHDRVLFSGCTIVRPYYKSLKWKDFITYFHDRVDLVVISNAGIIPMEYAECYPFLTYDAKHEWRSFKEYEEKLLLRLNSFLTKFGDAWDYRVYSFLPYWGGGGGKINRERQILSKIGIETLPTLDVYEDIRLGLKRKEFKGFNYTRYPLLTKPSIEQLAKELDLSIEFINRGISQNKIPLF